MSLEAVTVRRLEEYSAADAENLAQLLQHLNPGFDTPIEPIAEDTLREIIESDRSDQLVAEQRGRLVGAATLNLMVTTTVRKAYLDNFVTHPDVRGKGVGYQLWQAAASWCSDHNTRILDFLSRPDRAEAPAFYDRQGVTIMDNVKPHRIKF